MPAIKQLRGPPEERVARFERIQRADRVAGATFIPSRQIRLYQSSNVAWCGAPASPSAPPARAGRSSVSVQSFDPRDAHSGDLHEFLAEILVVRVVGEPLLF